MEENLIKTLKYNLLQMAPRPFGEKFGEWLVSILDTNLQKTNDNSHDLSLGEHRCEVKISRAFDKGLKDMPFNKFLLTESNHRFIKYNTNEKFDCNIQQVKPKCFDFLIYGVFFDEIIYLFKVSSDQILNDKKIGYVGKQHRGNTGEGQFHIKRNNMKYHIDNFLYKQMTWNELVDIIVNLDNE